MSRLDEVLALMARDDVDALLLGRDANARLVVDTTRLWLAGTRAFAPTCVVVRTSGAVHLLANSDDGVPAGFPADCLYGLTWNPATMFAGIAAIPGVAGARRIGVDGMSPLMFTMLTATFPDATFVDGSALLAELSRAPDPEAQAGVAAAAPVAAAGLAAMAAALVTGAAPRALRGTCSRAFAAHGVTTPAFEGVVAPLERGASTWLALDRVLTEGERVVLRSGALRAGWEASLARTYTVGTPSVEAPAPDGWDALVAACMPGVELGALRKRDAVIYGVGRGVEPWDDDLVLVPGHMIALETTDDVSLRQDVLRITDSDPEIVTRSG